MRYNNYNRTNPWDGISRNVGQAVSVEEALRLSKLDWLVHQRDLYSYVWANKETGEVREFNDIPDIKQRFMQEQVLYLDPTWEQQWTKTPDLKENYRIDPDNPDKSIVLGHVGSKYKICQNADGFNFVNDLLNSGGIQLETAGEFDRGQTIWLCGRMPEERKIVGDDFETYIVFTNNHGGNGAITCIVTPIRVWCRNTLNLALRKYKHKWTTRHTGDIKGKLKEAEKVLFNANNYMDELETYADRMANTPLLQNDLELMLKALFPTSEEDSKQRIENMERCRNEVMALTFMPDLAKFKDTQWGAINALADWVDHTDPKRKTKNYKENRFKAILNGHELLGNMMRLMEVKK